MKDTAFEEMNNKYAQQVIRQSQATGACLFLFDNRHQDENAISFLYQIHTPMEAIEAYSKLLYKYDSFLPHRKPENPQPPSPVLTRAKKKNSYVNSPDNNSLAKNSKKYWASLGDFGYQQTAAMIQTITEHLYLIIGLHLENPRKILMADRAQATLESWAHDSLDYVIDRSVSSYRLQFQGKPPTNEFQAKSKRLTKRESQVVFEVIQGKTNREIAEILSLSYYTVDNHLRRIYKKFDVHNRTELTSKLSGTTLD